MTHTASPPAALQWAPDGQQTKMRKIWNPPEPLALLLQGQCSRLWLLGLVTEAACAPAGLGQAVAEQFVRTGAQMVPLSPRAQRSAETLVGRRASLAGPGSHWRPLLNWHLCQAAAQPLALLANFLPLCYLHWALAKVAFCRRLVCLRHSCAPPQWYSEAPALAAHSCCHLQRHCTT